MLICPKGEGYGTVTPEYFDMMSSIADDGAGELIELDADTFSIWFSNVQEATLKTSLLKVQGTETLIDQEATGTVRQGYRSSYYDFVINETDHPFPLNLWTEERLYLLSDNILGLTSSRADVVPYVTVKDGDVTGTAGMPLTFIYNDKFYAFVFYSLVADKENPDESSTHSVKLGDSSLITKHVLTVSGAPYGTPDTVTTGDYELKITKLFYT